MPDPGDPAGGPSAKGDGAAGPDQGADAAKGPAGDTGPKLGAGGTSEAAKGAAESDTKGVAKGAGAVAAVPAVGVGAQLMVLLMFLNWLKGMFAAMLAMVMNLLNMIWMAILTVVKTVVGFALSVGAAIAGAVGGAISAVTGAAAAVGASLLAVATLVTGTVYSARENTTTAQRDAMPADCRAEAEKTVREIDSNTESGATSANMEATAEEVYSILAGMGMQDENIAGVLANFQHESGIDPTTVETIYNEPYEVGPRTREAEENGFQVELIDADYAADYPDIDLVGIGLGQWTNGRNKLLTDYAKSTGGEWYELETQLTFMLSEDDPVRVQFVQDLIENPSGSVEQSTEDWMFQWEGLTIESELTERQEDAKVWFAKLDGWEADEDRADSILEQAEATVDVANQNRRTAAVQECRTADVTSLSGAVGEVPDLSGMAAGGLVSCEETTTPTTATPLSCASRDAAIRAFPGAQWTKAGSAYCYRSSAGDHGSGRACDLMTSPIGTSGSAEEDAAGDQLALWYISNHESLGVKYVIWKQSIWNPSWSACAGERPGSEPRWPEWYNDVPDVPGGKWCGMPDRGSLTENHFDHVHISYVR
ncbi:phage tail tip lysozyme [Nocardiopsis aegyptia]|uniref:Phage tail lysozyme domain-containing protein n=1 Tax=Nocardiopsis aegyptia TaxID=220378 RepID=A0A7Z0JAY2_9ACTN|nr:phage tail tip lysozyme [Nocardiopsis aegyptia]NYJ34905.1 hypothetical protein [Nocardiopsis aegyptia]